MKAALHGALIIILTLVTQVGGLAWAIVLLTRRRLLVFVACYGALSFIAYALSDREPLPCFGAPLKVQSLGYCIANRHYVSPELKQVLIDTAEAVAKRHPGTLTLALDGNFPLFDGFPMLPHLSHDDGDKADLAFQYKDATGYRRGLTRSPMGYFAFEQGPTDCDPKWPTLRWDLTMLQPLWRDLSLEPLRTKTTMDVLLADARVGKVFLEPHLQQTLGLSHPKLRFQGCRAARHDDHIHLQL